MSQVEAAAGPLPYRRSVGAVLFDRRGLVLMARRADLPPDEAEQSGWQFPQGGIDDGEAPRDAVLREVREEIGTDRVRIIDECPEWLGYDFPDSVRLGGLKAAFRGQRQRWFAMRFLGGDSDIRLDLHVPAEFDAWRWLALEETARLVVGWKRPVYEQLMTYFSCHARPER